MASGKLFTNTDYLTVRAGTRNPPLHVAQFVMHPLWFHLKYILKYKSTPCKDGLIHYNELLTPTCKGNEMKNNFIAGEVSPLLHLTYERQWNVNRLSF